MMAERSCILVIQKNEIVKHAAKNTKFDLGAARLIKAIESLIQVMFHCYWWCYA